MKSAILKFGILSLGLIAFSQVHAQSNQRTPEQVFTKVDANSDNAIDLNEFTNMTARKSKGQHDPAKVAQRFDRIDTNSDGQINREEFTAMHEKRKAHKAQNKD